MARIGDGRSTVGPAAPTGEELRGQYLVAKQRQQGDGGGAPGDASAEIQALERQLMQLRIRRQRQARTGAQAPSMAGMDRQISQLELRRAHLMEQAGPGGPGGPEDRPPVRSVTTRPDPRFAQSMDLLGSFGPRGYGGGRP